MPRILNTRNLHVQVQKVHHAVPLRISTLYLLSYGVKYVKKYSLIQVNILAVRGCWEHFPVGKVTEA